MSASLLTIGLMLKAYDHMSGVVQGASFKSISSLGQVEAKIKGLSDQAERFGRTTMATGMVAAGAVVKPLQAFAELEDATTSLKVAMMDNLGQVPKQFEAINKQAIELGNLLPGTTADFINAARALNEQGTGFDTILNGGLKSASYLSVLLKMPAQDAAEMVAKLREAYGLADNELTRMADLTQRARFAFGMTPQDIKIASSYSGATQNVLGLTGLDNARKLLAMQGLGAGVSLEGSSWGTNFAQMLTRTAESKDKLAKNSKEMKAINAEMKAYGINLEFFNDKGAFMGLDNLVQQLEKTKVMTQVDQLNLFKRLFGVEAARPASIIASKGWAGYQEAIEKMERQASLQQRIDLSLGTIKNKWEALTGTITNGMAAIGEPIANFIAPGIVAMNEFVGGPMTAFIGQHQTLIGVLGTTMLVAGLLAVGLGGLGLAAAGAGKFIGGGIGAITGMGKASRFAIGFIRAHQLEILRLMGVQRAHIVLTNLHNAVAYRGGVWKALQFALLTTQYRMLAAVSAGRLWAGTQLMWVRMNLLSSAGLRGLAASFGGGLIGGIRGATIAVRAFSLALLTNPLAWIGALAVGAALLIYKYWKPISGFFSGLWQGLSSGLGPLMPLFKQIGGALSWLFAPLRLVWWLFSSISERVDDTGGAARNLGVSVGQGIASAILWVGNLGRAVFELPGKFFDAGVDIVLGLGRGIESLAHKPVEAISNLGSGIANAFKGLLGIRSPSRIFMGFGDNIGMGAALGIEGSLPRVQKAVNGLAGTALTGARGPAVVGPVRMPSGAGAAGGDGQIVVHFAPVIQLAAGSNAGDQVRGALADSYREFEANMRRFMADQQRRKF